MTELHEAGRDLTSHDKTNLSFYCQKYRCRMTSVKACRKYQKYEFGVACSNCEQMKTGNVFESSDKGVIVFHKQCQICGTENKKLFCYADFHICRTCKKEVNRGNQRIRSMEDLESP